MYVTRGNTIWVTGEIPAKVTEGNATPLGNALSLGKPVAGGWRCWERLIRKMPWGGDTL